jgi:hypothetical protein
MLEKIFLTGGDKVMIGMLPSLKQIEQYCYHLPSLVNGIVTPSKIIEMVE